MNVSSGRGVFTFPRDSVYHVTKHALETYSDSLRLEMKKFGVKVSVILPGHYGAATACQDSIQVNSEAHTKKGPYIILVQIIFSDPLGPLSSFQSFENRVPLKPVLGGMAGLAVSGITALWDSISVYIGPSPREREKEKRSER